MSDKKEWIEVTPNIIWTGGTAPSGEQKFFYKENEDSTITFKATWENTGVNINGLEVSFKKETN